MTLYTGKGDDGTTKTFGCDQRISKSSNVAEALGSLDEINSFLGFVKVKSTEVSERVFTSSLIKPVEQAGNFKILGKDFSEIVNDVQQNLFIIQAEVAGSEMTISEEKLKECESYVDETEKILPPIRTFFVSGGTELASIFDIARTLARRAERRVIDVVEDMKKENEIQNNSASGHKTDRTEFGKFSLAYLNRLSSLLYAMARLSNHFAGIVEDAPSYK